jgi:hypothetical protein
MSSVGFGRRAFRPGRVVTFCLLALRGVGVDTKGSRKRFMG